jgi:hypothetical protein
MRLLLTLCYYHYPISVNVGFLVNDVESGHVFLEYFGIPANSYSTNCLISLICHPEPVKWAIQDLSTKGLSLTPP